MAVCRSKRLSEEIIAECVHAHYLQHHKLPPGITDELFEKWCSKMASAIKEMTLKFKHLYTVSPKSAKSHKITEMKRQLTKKLQGQDEADSEDPGSILDEPDALPLLEEQVAPWQALDSIIAARAKKREADGDTEGLQVASKTKPATAEQQKEDPKAAQLALPPEARNLLQL